MLSPGATRPDGLLGETVVLHDVGPIHRLRPHPLYSIVVYLLPTVAAVLVAGLVLLPAVVIVADAVAGEGGFLRESASGGRVWGLDGLASVILRTVVWAVLVPGLIAIVGLILAFGLRDRLRWRLGGALIAPAAVPLVVTGVTFRLLYHPDSDRGPVTYLLGFVPGAEGWLGARWITISLILAFAWVWLGLTVLVFHAVIERLPRELAVVARVAGRRRLRSTNVAVFEHAYWQPGLRRVVGVMYVLLVVMSVRTLDLILVMAPGSVLDDARVLSVMHYQQSVSAPTATSAALGTLWLLATALVLAAAVAAWRRPAWPIPRASNRASPGPRRAVTNWIVTATIGFWLAPIFVLVMTALHSPHRAAVSGWWSLPLGTGSFRQLGSTGFAASLVLTAGVTIAVCLVSVIVAGLAVEALQRLSARPVRPAFVVMVAAAVVPVQVIAGPANAIFDLVGLAGVARLILVHVALAVPLCVVVLLAARASVLNLARDASQAARRPAGITRLRRARIAAGTLFGSLDREPAVSAALVLVFLQVWNDLVVGLFFSGPDAATPLGVLLYGQTRQFVANSGPLAAGAVLALAVPVALLVQLRHRLIDGLIGVHGAASR
jgi:alpha-glucoside transport system permease protein